MSQPIIKSLTIDPYQVNTYLVYCPETKEGVIIDPAGDEEALASLAREAGVKVRYILNTHGHPDHALGNARLKELVAAPVALHQADDDFFASDAGREVAECELGLACAPRTDVRLEHGQRLSVGGLEIEVIHTPGHSPGSACFLIGGHLFTGDTLFVGAVGRTDLGGASLDSLLQSIEERILPLPEETIIHPGHDYGESPTSTLASEKEENPYITDFILGT